jgi:sugar lactone lactonase YvrE
MRAFLILLVSAATLSGCGVASTSGSTPSVDETPAVETIRTFAELPVTPGQPGGIWVDGDTVYVDTFGFVVRPTDGADNVYAYNLDTGALLDGQPNPALIPRRFQVCIMGMAGMAQDAAGRLYLVDMNSRIVRLDPKTGATEDYATFPTSAGGANGSTPNMPLDMVFAPDGAAYVSDIGGLPIIWRVPPGGGQAEIWFTDSHLAGVYSQGGGGLKLDPAGEILYAGIVTSDQNSARGTVYKLSLKNPSDIALFHQYGNNVENPPLGAGPLGMAVGKSGKLYIAMPGTNQVSILNPDGSEERRIDFPASTQFVALTRKGTLLVTAWNFPDGPWPVYEIAVHDTPGGVFKP